MPDVVIPKMGMTMQEATLVEWLRDDGAAVEAGEPIFVLSTDKLDAEVEADVSGVLRHTVGPGTTLPVGGVVGQVVAEGEAVSPPDEGGESTTPGATPPPAKPSSDVDGAPTVPIAGGRNSGGRLVASPNARRLARELGVQLTLVEGSGPSGRIVGRDVERAAAAGQEHRVPARGAPASFAARRLAATLNVDLDSVSPSGPTGEICRQDVERTVAVRLAGGGADSAVRQNLTKAERIPLTGMRGVIARRMHDSLSEMAQLTITTQAPVKRLVRFRAQLKDEWTDEARPVPSYTDFVIKACALALRRHPALNARVGPDAIELLDDVHIGVAVALDEGLVVPVVQHADRQSLDALAATTRDLAQRARSKKLDLDELAGATFSVTSLGSHGIDAFTPVINPPNVAILGIGRIFEGVEWKGKSRRRPRPLPLMTLSLTFDHRAVDGAPAAAFLAEVSRLLEGPTRLL